MEIAELLLFEKKYDLISKLSRLSEVTGYPIYNANNNSQRIFGPHPRHAEQPPNGSEVFVSRLPPDADECELVPFFAKVGKIHMIRLSLTPSGVYNKGFAFVTYSSPQEAQQCVRMLKYIEFRDDLYLSIEISLDNNRIFIGGIPENKSKDEVWQELTRTGMKGIVDIIMYRSYVDRNKNRGFVFVQFNTHQDAAEKRNMFKNVLLWGERVHVDWSAPIPNVAPGIMAQVKRLFLRNLDVNWTRRDLEKFILQILGDITLEKIYKFKDYAFLHFTTRRDAQRGLALLKEVYRRTEVEVTWAIPQKYAFKHRQHRTKTDKMSRQQYSHSSIQTSPFHCSCEKNARHVTNSILNENNLRCDNPKFLQVEDEAYEEILRMFRHLQLDG